MCTAIRYWIVLLLLAVCMPTEGQTVSTSWQDKVAPAVLNAKDPSLEFFVFLKEQAQLSPAASLTTKRAKNEFVFNALRETAARTQPAIISQLAATGVEFRSFWIVNAIWVRADRELLADLAQREDVSQIYANSRMSLDQRTLASPRAEEEDDLVRTIPTNLQLVHAPEVWAEGFRGQNVRVAHIDTGVEWQHPALINQYEGWNGEAADHNYHWFDAFGEYLEPTDPMGHGTATMGIMVGDDGGQNQIGMAPAARWIACRALDFQGVGALVQYLACFEWLLAPTDLAGQNPDPSRAPDVVSNSWECGGPGSGCEDPEILRPVFTNLRAAGISPVAGGGNYGPACSTMYFLPSIYAEVFSVGVTNLVGTISSNSSRGPVLLDGSNRIKPDIVAPYAARTSFPGGIYGGTGAYVSLSVPHGAGAIALLISARPELAGHVVAMEELIEQTAVPKTTSQNCGDISGSEIPNNTYGWGLLDVYAAYVAATEITSSPGNLPGTYNRLLPVEPNPFNPRTTIRFELASSQRVAIDVYDSRGALVAKVTEGICGPGPHAVTWNGDGLRGEALSSGIYLLRLVMGEDVLTQKLTLVR